MDFRNWFEEKASLQPDAPYILFEDQVYTYGETDARANRAANLFGKLGLGQGDNCALVMNNAPEFLFVAFNNDHPVLGDSRVRLALSMAVDRERLTRSLIIKRIASSRDNRCSGKTA